MAQLYRYTPLIRRPVCPDKDRVSVLDPSRSDGQAQVTTAAGLLRWLCRVVNMGDVYFEDCSRLFEVLRYLLDLHEMVNLDVDQNGFDLEVCNDVE